MEFLDHNGLLGPRDVTIFAEKGKNAAITCCSVFLLPPVKTGGYGYFAPLGLWQGVEDRTGWFEPIAIYLLRKKVLWA